MTAWPYQGDGPVTVPMHGKSGADEYLLFLLVFEPTLRRLLAWLVLLLAFLPLVRHSQSLSLAHNELSNAARRSTCRVRTVRYLPLLLQLLLLL